MADPARLLWVLGATAIVVVVPVMGFCFPWGRLAAANGPTLRVLTCNVKGRCINNVVLDRLIAQTKPDIIALQGCWSDVRVRWPAGWHVCQFVDFVVASRYPVTHEGPGHSWQLPERWRRMDMVRFTIQADGRNIDFCSVHLLSPHLGLEAVLDRQTVLSPSDSPTLDAEIDTRWEESKDVHWLASGLASPILAGDFNLPADSAIYRAYWSEYRDAFSDGGLGFGYTEWPRVPGRFFGIRIDHVLTGPGWRCRRCWVGPDIGSDHLPLIADLSRTSSN